MADVFDSLGNLLKDASLAAYKLDKKATGILQPLPDNKALTKRKQDFLGLDIRKTRRIEQGKDLNAAPSLIRHEKELTIRDPRSESGYARKMLPATPNANIDLHHFNGIGNAFHVFEGLSLEDSMVLWNHAKKWKLPLGNDIRNLIELPKRLHQSGKSKGVVDIHQLLRNIGITGKRYIPDNATMPQRLKAIESLARDHQTGKLAAQSLSFTQNLIGEENKLGGRGSLVEAVLGEGNAEWSEDYDKKVKDASKKKNRNLRIIRKIRGSEYFNDLERSGHNAAVNKGLLSQAVQEGLETKETTSIARDIKTTKKINKNKQNNKTKARVVRQDAVDADLESKDGLFGDSDPTFYDPGGYTPPIMYVGKDFPGRINY